MHTSHPNVETTTPAEAMAAVSTESDDQPITCLEVELIGQDGNAFSILARVLAALRRGGHADLVEPFLSEATNGSYDHLLSTCRKYVHVR